MSETENTNENKEQVYPGKITRWNEIEDLIVQLNNHTPDSKEEATGAMITLALLEIAKGLAGVEYLLDGIRFNTGPHNPLNKPQQA